MIEILTVVLEKMADAFLGVLAEKVPDELWVKLKGDPAKNAIKRSLGAAIGLYARPEFRRDLVRPLLQKGGPLTSSAVADELTQLVRFEREPNAELIGRMWKASMDNPPPWCDFTDEAKRLLKYLQDELRGTEVFRPVFDAKRLDAITIATTASAASLARIEAQLTDLAQLTTARLDKWHDTMKRALPSLREQLLDSTSFIEERTHNFIGRQFVFDAIAHFIETQPRGYFFIYGDPGIGKTALSAYLVRTNGYVHHFNRRSEGINRAETFLRNICAQLIVAYQLNHASLPPEATQDAGFLNRLLTEVSNTLGPAGKAVIVVDALDEVESTGLSPSVNALYLPPTLPQGIFLVVTTRRGLVELRIECEQGIFDIAHDSPENITDIQAYIKRAVWHSGIQAYITAQGIDNELFIGHLVEKSEGNFMYLRYVLPEIEYGAYKDLGLEALPRGLQNYYEDHWRRMGMMIWPLPHAKIKIVYVLAEVRRPVSRSLIADFAKEDELTVQAVFDEWQQFLHEQLMNERICYSLYHSSFREFLHRKEIVQAAGVTSKSINALIADNLWQELFGHEQSQ